MNKELLKFVALVFLLVTFQVLGAFQSSALPNFQPIAALLFCGFATMKKGLSWLTLGAWFIAYPFTTRLNGDYDLFSTTLLVQVFALALIIGLGYGLSKYAKKSFVTLLFGSVLSAGLFYAVTNTFSWLSSPLYTKDWVGFYEAFWAGPKGSALPTWSFFRNSLAANVLFTSLYGLSMLKIKSLSLNNSSEKELSLDAK